LNIFLSRFGDFRGARAAVEQACDIAQAIDDPTGLIITDWMLGASHHLLGDQAAAQLYCERGFSRAAEFGPINANFFGFDHRIATLAILARALWLRGFSERARTTAQIAIDEAASRHNPVLLCFSLSYCLSIFLWTGDLEKAADLIERLISQAERYSLRPYGAIGIALKGELAVSRNELETGLDLLRNALGTLHRVQHNVLNTGFTGMLAECLTKTGQFDEALLTINGAIARSKNGGPTFDLAELQRIKARALAGAPQHGRAPAIDCLREALAAARDQSALAFELRSATDLARLLSERGQRDEAGRTLALVYDRFTEGFETSDLRIARRLIEDLA
jgi:ATP/maltotriose-dependent transcriptional regulator MalT